MKLSEVVRYLNHLDQEELISTLSDVTAQAELLLRTTIDQPGSIPTFNSEIESDFDKIKYSVQQFVGTVYSIRTHLQGLVAEQEPELYAQSQRLYEDDMIYETTEYILNRRLSHSDEQKNDLLARVKLHTDWRWPGMLFRPGADNLIEDFVPLDPLYIIDQHQDLLTPATQQFPALYQQRIRQYVIDDRVPGEILKLLPNNNFGFVFANTFFNFKPLTLINQYLDELYQKMRPGGVLIFTYNDCDYWQGVDLAERNFMCYTPGSKIRAHAESLGFLVEKNITNPPNAAWFEMTKPGELESLRGGQTLGKLIPK